MSTEATPSSAHSRTYSWTGRRRRMSLQSRHPTRSVRAGEINTSQQIPSMPSSSSTLSSSLPENTAADPLPGPSLFPRPSVHRRPGSTFSTTSSSTLASNSSGDQANSFWHGSLRRFLKVITFRQDSLAARDSGGSGGGTSGGEDGAPEEYTHHLMSQSSEETPQNRLCLSCQHQPWQNQHQHHAQHHSQSRRNRKHKQLSHHHHHHPHHQGAAQAGTTGAALNRCLSTGFCMGCGDPLEHIGTNSSHLHSGPAPLLLLPSPSSTSCSRRNQEKRAAAAAAAAIVVVAASASASAEATGGVEAADMVDRQDRNQDPSYAGPSSMVVDDTPQPQANTRRQRSDGSRRRGGAGGARVDLSPECRGHFDHTNAAHYPSCGPDMESSGRGGSSSESKSRRSSAAQGSRRKGCTGSTTSNEVVRQHLTGVAGGGEYYPHIRHSKRISMAPHDAMQRRLAAIAAATSGSTSTALPMPYIPTVDDVAARRGSSSSTGTQERVVCWTDITRAEDEDMDLDTVDDGKIEDLDSEGQGHSRHRHQDKSLRAGRRPRRSMARRRRSVLGTHDQMCSSPTSLVSSPVAGSSPSLSTPSGSCASLALELLPPQEETPYHRPSPIELPEILHLIFNALVHLTPPEDFSQRDLLQCLMVCKQWYVVGQKTLWRDIRFREPEQLHRFISFLQSTLPPRMPEADDQSQAEDDALRMPGAWGVEPVERLGIENGQSRRSVDVRMRMDGFDGQDEEEEEEEEEEADVIMSEASEASPYHQLVRETVDNSTLSFTSPKAVEQRILDRASAVKKIVLHKFKTLTDVEVLPLTTWFPNLTSIEFYICELLTDAVVISLAEHCPRLQFLLLPGCAKVTDEGIKAVARNCPRLRHLDLRACSLVSDDSLIEIAAHCPDLWHLNCGRVTGAHRVTGKSIVPIARNTNLNTLGLAGCGMTDEAVIKIAEYCREGLNRISLNCCVELTSASIRALMVFCPNLAVLEIKKCLRIRDMAPLNHFVRQRILVELCPDLQKRLVAYKVELASQQAATAAAAGRASGSAASSAVAGATAASSTTTTLWQESDDATHESQQQNPHSGSNRVQTGGAQAGATVLPSSSQTVPTSSSSAFTNSTTSTTEMNAIMTTTTTTTTTMTTTTTTASTANTTIVTTR